MGGSIRPRRSLPVPFVGARQSPFVPSEDLPKALRRVFRGQSLWRALAAVGTQGCGPFDGGCLISAKAMIAAVGHGDLVRIVRDDQTQHYGARIAGAYFDFDGPADTAEQWIQRFAKNEHLEVTGLGFAEGEGQEHGEIPDEPAISTAIAALLLKAHEAEVNGPKAGRQTAKGQEECSP